MVAVTTIGLLFGTKDDGAHLSPSSSDAVGAPPNGKQGQGKGEKETTGTSACPYSTGGAEGGKNTSSSPNAVKIFNVYSEEINPKNQMPYNKNQWPTLDQKKPLSTKRVQSSIPKSGTNSTWTYPSPQIFFNALKRKDKADDVTEDDMSAVVAVHNSMNEQTWRKLLVWEKSLHPDTVDTLKLVRFKGRPHDLSPKARLLSLLGMRPKPFDRHDWIVTRNEKDATGGSEVRYVIDYYYDEAGNIGNTKLPNSSKSDESGRVIYVDVRPAIDSMGSAIDRVRMLFSPTNDDDFVVAPFESDAASSTMATEGCPMHNNSSESETTVDEVKNLEVDDVESETTAMREKQRVLQTNATIGQNCRAFIANLKTCETEQECNMALMGLKLCMAKHICEASVVDRFLNSGEGTDGEETWKSVQDCLSEYDRHAAQVLVRGKK